LKIKRQIKREKAKRKRTILLSVIVMLAMPYIVSSLNSEGIFRGWEVYFAFSYAALVDLLLFVNIIRVISEDKFDFEIYNEKIRIKSGVLRSPFSISLDKVVYVDVSEKSKEDFEMLIICQKGKRSRKFFVFNSLFVRKNKQYREAYNFLKNTYPDKEFWCYPIKNAGARKYYFLYLIFKSAYHVEFSDRALDYIKRFMEEYNLS
jgi:hypothetical protein